MTRDAVSIASYVEGSSSRMFIELVFRGEELFGLGDCGPDMGSLELPSNLEPLETCRELITVAVDASCPEPVVYSFYGSIAVLHVRGGAQVQALGTNAGLDLSLSWVTFQCRQ